MNGPRRNRPEPVDRDTYRSNRKLPSGTHCPACGLVVRDGRWSRPLRGEAPEGDPQTCPACRREKDRMPAGTIEVRGDLGAQVDDLCNLLRNVEVVEGQEHPLERLMHLSVEPGGLEVRTTGVHLARRMVSALERQLHLKFDVRFGEEECLLRAQAEVG